MRWTPSRIDIARDVLSKYPFGSLDAVLARLSEIFGHKVAAADLGGAFERAGLSSPETYMADAPRKHCRTCRCRVKK